MRWLAVLAALVMIAGAAWLLGRGSPDRAAPGRPEGGDPSDPWAPAASTSTSTSGLSPSAAAAGGDAAPAEGEETVESLIAKLKHPRWDVADEAARKLGERKAAEAVPALIEALGRKEPGIRDAFCRALCRIGEPARAAVPEIARVLQDPDAWSSTQIQAAWALLHLDPVGAMPTLTDVLSRGGTDAEHLAQAAVCGTFEQFDPTGVPDIVPAIVHGLEHEDPFVRFTLVTALARIVPADPAAVAPLEECLADEDSEVRAVAARGLVAAGRSRPEVVRVLVASLGEDEDSALEAAEALGEIGPGAAAAVPALIAAAGHENRYVRNEVAIALGRIGDATAVPALRRLLADETRWVRPNAALALFRIDGDAVRTAAVLVEEIREWSSTARAEAVEAFREMGEVARVAIPDLTRLLEHQDPDVAEAAKEAIDAIEGR